MGLSVWRETSKKLTVYRVCYTPIETLVSWRAVSKLVSFLQARISSSIGLLLLVFCCKTRKKVKRRNFLRRQDFGEKEERKGEGARRGGRFLLRVTI